MTQDILTLDLLTQEILTQELLTQEILTLDLLTQDILTLELLTQDILTLELLTMQSNKINIYRRRKLQKQIIIFIVLKTIKHILLLLSLILGVCNGRL